MKKNNYYFFALICCVALLLISCGKKHDKFTIGFVQMTEDEQLDRARQGVYEALEQAGFKDKDNIEILYKNAQGEIPNITTIMNYFVSEQVDMVITSTTPCMVAAAKQIKNVPVVYTVAFGPEQLGMKKPDNMTGVFDPCDLDSTFAYIKMFIPDINRVATIYTNSEQNAVFAFGKLQKYCTEHNIELIANTLTSTNDLTTVAEALAQQNIDCFVVSADNTVYSALNALTMVAKKHRLPVIVTDPSFTQRGAMMGFGVDYHTWGFEGGKIAAQIIKGKKVSEIPAKIFTDNEKDLYLNLIVAKELGFNLSNDFVSKAKHKIE